MPAGSLRATRDFGLSSAAAYRAPIIKSMTLTTTRGWPRRSHMFFSLAASRKENTSTDFSPLTQQSTRSKHNLEGNDRAPKWREQRLESAACQGFENTHVEAERVEILVGMDEFHVRCLSEVVGVHRAEVFTPARRRQGDHAVVGSFGSRQNVPGATQRRRD